MSTNNTNTKAAAMSAAEITKLNPSEVAAKAAALLKAYGTISAIKAKAPAFLAKYGRENWAAILGDAKRLRGEDIKAAGENARAVFTYAGILGAVFAVVEKSKGYKTLCKYARAKYSGKPGEVAAAVIRDYYSAVDNTGRPVSRVSYVSETGSMIFDTYEVRELTKTAAVTILESSLKGMENAAAKAMKRGQDTAKATRDNTKTPGAIVAVYAAAVDDDGAMFKGSKLDGADIDKVLGRQVPGKSKTLAEVNAAIKAARAEVAKAPKATAAEKHAAKTPAPAKAPKTPKGAAPAKAVDSKAAAEVAAA